MSDCRLAKIFINPKINNSLIIYKDKAEKYIVT